MPVEAAFEGSPSAKRPNPSSVKVTREPEEGSSYAQASLLNAIKLLGVSMGFKSVSDNSKSFADFIEAVIAKLDLSEVQSSREDKSFVFGFWHMVKVKTFYFFFFIFCFLLSV